MFPGHTRDVHLSWSSFTSANVGSRVSFYRIFPFKIPNKIVAKNISDSEVSPNSGWWEKKNIPFQKCKSQSHEWDD